MFDESRGPVRRENIMQRLRQSSEKLSVAALRDLCNGCGQCVMACPSALIFLDHNGLPQLVSEELCAQCGICVDACHTGADDSGQAVTT